MTQLKEQPENKDGQNPSRTPDETVDRLEQKKHEDVGQANRKRIEQKEREITPER